MPGETRIPIVVDADVVIARQSTRQLAVQLGFSSCDVVAIATAVSEIGRNIVTYAGRGEIVLTNAQQGSRRGIIVVARDAGGGIPVARTGAAALPRERAAELSRLGALATWNARSLAPRTLIGTKPLTGPRTGEPAAIAREFLHASRNLWGLSADEVEALALDTSYTDRHSGLTHVFFRQHVGGVPVFTAAIGVHVDGRGRVLAFGGDTYAGLTAGAPVALLPEDAARIAAAGVGVDLAPRRIRQDGPTVILDRGPLVDDVRVERWIYPLLAEPRPAWRMLVHCNMPRRLTNWR